MPVAHVLRGGPRGQLPAHRGVCGQNPKGSQARGSTRGATDEVRAGDQSQDGEADRCDYSAEGAGKSGSSHKMTVGSEQQKVRSATRANSSLCIYLPAACCPSACCFFKRAADGKNLSHWLSRSKQRFR